MSVFSPVILYGRKFTNQDVLKKVIPRFKNIANISRTSFDIDKLFQINVVYRIQFVKRVSIWNYEINNFYQTETNNFFPWP